MSQEVSRQNAREEAKPYLESGNATGWFEPFYASAAGNPHNISWADLAPNPNLIEWLDREAVHGDSRNALVVGCGLGDDAEELARRGFVVTAFDVAPSAVVWCKERFPRSSVTYEVADLLNPPEDWVGRFDFVLEVYTLQCLPPANRPQAFLELGRLAAPGGQLLIICRGRDDQAEPGNLPWPLSKAELSQFDVLGFQTLSFEDFLDEKADSPTRRFRVLYQKQP
ncbi:MAG: class I SAM-dependent methyltransferase [Chloroflexi bacterium]|nr:class I SAM-dependent methyltransferase [Chloroflexota bacterium]OJV97088.1 MAG: hypothetical protein BGO39_18975 [Chloroflexi bacterium 54-19]